MSNDVIQQNIICKWGSTGANTVIKEAENVKKALTPEQKIQKAVTNAKFNEEKRLAVLKAMGPQLKKTTHFTKGVTRTTEHYTKIGKRWHKTGQHINKTLNGFNMNLLGIGFAGKMIGDAMWGLLGPAFEASGIFEIFSSVLTVFFLPIALALLPFLLDIADIFMNLPEGVQLVIGTFIVMAALTATLVSTFGFLAVGIGSATASLGVGGGAVGLLGALAPIAPIIIGIAAAVAIFVYATSKNLGGINDIIGDVGESFSDFFKLLDQSGVWKNLGIWIDFFISTALKPLTLFLSGVSIAVNSVGYAIAAITGNTEMANKFSNNIQNTFNDLVGSYVSQYAKIISFYGGIDVASSVPPNFRPYAQKDIGYSYDWTQDIMNGNWRNRSDTPYISSPQRSNSITINNSTSVIMENVNTMDVNELSDIFNEKMAEIKDDVNKSTEELLKNLNR